MSKPYDAGRYDVLIGDSSRTADCVTATIATEKSFGVARALMLLGCHT